ncbi:hypothetical protein ZWY2020_016855 [Hordeum vulgare]|nr:hypothetical protein ZWY2020_016855 [Hordeum vulgare]
MPRGDPLRNQGPLINKISSSINKPSPINPRLLPQGTGALIGKSALLGTGGPPSRPPTLTASPTPLASQTTSSPKPSSGTPASVHVPDKATSSAKVVSAGLQKKTTSLLDDYFGIRILDEAQQCIEELQCPDYHPEIVKEAINLALDKGASFVDPLVKLLEHLYTKKTFKTEDLENGCLLYGSLLEHIGIDLLKAPTQFGEVVAHLILSCHPPPHCRISPPSVLLPHPLLGASLLSPPVSTPASLSLPVGAPFPPRRGSSPSPSATLSASPPPPCPARRRTSSPSPTPPRTSSSSPP